MQVSKIGAVFLVSTLALAGIGASYAGLFDEINIHGEVSTAYVDFEVEKYSGTWVWKDADRPEHEMIVYQGDAPPTFDEDTAEGFARGRDSSDPAYDAEVVFDNIFPLEDGFIPDETWVDGGYALWMADISFHYIGSIPIHINNDIIIEWYDVYYGPDDEFVFGDFEEYIESYGGTVDVELWYRATSIDPQAERVLLTPCTQLHYCDHVDVIVKIDLPQNNDLQYLSATGYISIPSIQWNEFTSCTLPEKNYENIPTKSCTQVKHITSEAYWKVDVYDTTPDPPVNGWNPNIDFGTYDGPEANWPNWDSYGWCVDQDHTLPTYSVMCETMFYSSLNHLSTDPTEWPQLYDPTDPNTDDYDFLWGNEHDPDLADPDTPKYNMPMHPRDGYSMNWPCINYIINHWRNGDFDTALGITTTASNIQNAIWWYCDGVTWAGIGANAQDVVEYTNTQVSQTWWDNFPNDDETWYAVLLDFHNSVEKQFIFIEVDP